jgi:tRNA(adenine34) deaminase
MTEYSSLSLKSAQASNIEGNDDEISHKQEQLDMVFMQRAFELAQQAEQHNEIPVGAVVVYQGKIIAEGYNQSIMLNDPSSHAEMNAIRQAGAYLNNYRLLDCTLYVTLEPCPMCAGLLVHSRIKRLVYASKDLKTGAAGSALNLVNNPQLNHQLIVDSGVMQEDCSQLLSSFFKRRRKEKKISKQTAKKIST